MDYILDLPGVKVESCTQIEGKILLGLSIVGEGMACHRCQNYTEQLHHIKSGSIGIITQIQDTAWH